MLPSDASVLLVETDDVFGDGGLAFRVGDNGVEVFDDA